MIITIHKTLSEELQVDFLRISLLMRPIRKFFVILDGIREIPIPQLEYERLSSILISDGAGATYDRQ